MDEVYCSKCGRMYENDKIMRFYTKEKDGSIICEKCLQKLINVGKIGGKLV